MLQLQLLRWYKEHVSAVYLSIVPGQHSLLRAQGNARKEGGECSWTQLPLVWAAAYCSSSAWVVCGWEGWRLLP